MIQPFHSMTSCPKGEPVPNSIHFTLSSMFKYFSCLKIQNCDCNYSTYIYISLHILYMYIVHFPCMLYVSVYICTIALISHASKIMPNIFQARLQQYMNQKLPDIQPGYRKGRETRDQIANIHWVIEKEREFQENIYFSFTDYAKAFNCVDHNKLGKIINEMGIPGHLT